MTNPLEVHSRFYLSLPYAISKGDPVVKFYSSINILNFVPCQRRDTTTFHDILSLIYNPFLFEISSMILNSFELPILRWLGNPRVAINCLYLLILVGGCLSWTNVSVVIYDTLMIFDCDRR